MKHYLKTDFVITPKQVAHLLNATTKKYLLSPYPCEIDIYDMGSLYAGKIHAVLCRNWKHRFKGRDLYDLVFYVSSNAHVNLENLRSRLVQSDVIKDDDVLKIEDVRSMLTEKMDDIDFETSKNDVIPFITDPRSLNVWKKEFFIDVISRIE